MHNSFWHDKTVFITGHEGFLGTNLTRKLIDAGAVVIGLDIQTLRRRTLLTASDYRRMISINGSVADRSLVSRLIRKHKPSVIFHLAAAAIVSECNKDPLTCFASNIEGTWNILEVARQQSGINAIVVASSDKAYGSHKVLPYTESASLKGDHPYDVSKSCADLIAYTYAHTYRLPVATTRCGNIYGPGDYNFTRIVPDAMRCLYQRKTLEIRSDGKCTRDYVYVDDIVDGYIRIAEQMEEKSLSGASFNLSDENPISVIRLLSKIQSATGKKLSYVVRNTAQYEIKHQYLASAKARRILAWKPRFSLEQGLVASAEWYQKIITRRVA